MSSHAHTDNAFRDPALFVNRELSWLRYNERVLRNGLDPSYPLVERLRFMSYFCTNLDEFVMIRVANLLEFESADRITVGPDGLTPTEQLNALATETHTLIDALHSCLVDDILPGLEAEGVRLLPVSACTEDEQADLEDYFQRTVSPVLTPMTVDPSHPFPHLPNLQPHLFVVFHTDAFNASDDDLTYVIVEVPDVLQTLIPIDGDPESGRFVLLADLIRHFVGSLFPGFRLQGAWQFRVTRDADLALREPEVEDMLLDMERELHQRTFRRAVRLEIEASVPTSVLRGLQDSLHLTERETYAITGPFNVPALTKLGKLRKLKHLSEPPFNPRLSPRMASSESIFSIIREKDLLLHHPYESFSTVTEFLTAAAKDPRVLAIKLTLYRTSGDSVIIDALKEAAANGKAVTAVVELKARFDEKNNIIWARELERAGCHVVYGIVGLKTHCKAALVVRREGNVTRRYSHLSTGNYNSTTARVYTDIGFLTADPVIGQDVSTLFNVLTGYSSRHIHAILNGKLPRPHFDKLVCSPFEMIGRFIELIDDEARFHAEGGDGLILAKFNSLVDPSIIRALYRASCAGVKIRLVVRGINCLRPGIPGVSENIEVVSVVDRYLEHPRVFYFHHGGEEIVFVSSADWMPRNLFRRIESMFPIEDPDLKARMRDEIIDFSFDDTGAAWRAQPDGRYTKIAPAPGENPLRSQLKFIEHARKAGLKSIPYERALREPRATKKKTTRAKKKKS